MGYFLFYIPHTFGVIIGVAIIIAGIVIRKEQGSWNFSEYYQNYIEKSYKRETKIEQLLWHTQIVVIYSAWILCALGFLYYIGEVFEKTGYNKVFDYTDEMVKQITQSNGVINWFGLVITVTVVLVAFKKKYYLAFSIEDVLAKYQYSGKLFFLISIVLLTEIFNTICVMMQSYNKWQFAFEMGSVILYFLAIGVSIYMLCVVITIIFSKEHKELVVLNNLYYKTKPMIYYSEEDKEIDDKALYMNIEYLLDQYSFNYRKVKAGDIKEIKCDNVFEKEKDNVYSQILTTLCKLWLRYSLICLTLYIVCGWRVLSENCCLIVDMVKSLIVSGIVWFVGVGILKLCGKIFVPLKQLVNRLFMHDYFLKFKKEDKEFFVSIHDIGLYRKHAGFFKSVLNMVVFFKMLGSNLNTMQKMLNQIEKLYAYPSRANHLGKEQMYYFVMIYYSFLCYVQFEQPERKKIINRYKGREWIDRLQNRVIRDLAIAMIKCTENEADKMIKKYDGFVKACVRS